MSKEDEEVEYRPDLYLEWVIDVDPGVGRSFAREDVAALLGAEWRRRFAGAWIYGLSLTNGKWTYALSGSNPERFSRLKIGVSLLEYSGGLDEYLNAVKSKFNTSAEVVILESVEEAVFRADALKELTKVLHRDVLIVLKSDAFYPGELAWNVLTEGGLEWGDGDLFHWVNVGRIYGDDNFFSVWTTTAPGYFFPESIKAGRYNPTDLVFGYWISRSADPVGVFEVLIEVVEYCRQKLGGVLLGRDGLPFDPEKERAEVQRVVLEMRAKGFDPGENKALRVFQ